MIKRYFLVIFTLFFTVSAGVFAQSRDFIPYVSQIRVEARNNLIRLTWADSPDARGPVFIFRAARPFSGSIPANIRPIVVNYGEQVFIDDIDDMENVHYFIAASDTSGRRYDVLLPRINSTSLILVRAQEEQTPEILVPSTIPEGIFNLRASRDGERVIIAFDTSDPRRRAILYRSTQPIHRPQDLFHAVIVQTGINSPFIDFPVHGFTWYYTVVYEDEITNGNVEIRPGINATVSAVTIINELAEQPSLRSMPLPLLTLRNDRLDSFFLTESPGQIPLSAQTVDMLRDIQMPQKEPLNLKKPRVFSVDLAAPTGAEESALFQIITEHFLQFEWETARDCLLHYLSLPRSNEIEARGRFYLGQTLYYTGRHREALIEFLAFRAFQPAEANAWIDAVLTAMVH